MEETTVMIVGAGLAGVAASACLNHLNISNIVKKSYDRLKLHLAKEFCELPFMHFPFISPKFIPKKGFVNHSDNYVSCFGISSRRGAWVVQVRNTCTNMHKEYVGQFLVVATGENSEGIISDIPGLNNGFGGEFLHSLWVSMFLLKYLSLEAVEELNNGNLSKHGIKRPKQGPFLLKATRGRSATIDVGCVFPSIKNIQGKHVEFINENVRKFDAILFATGYKRENGIYCTGFARQGLMSITNDAKKIAEDINFLLNKNKRNNWIRCD
ncbi:hypothetical protein ACOSQ4_009847 [Xanthoceras sorbifolium]